MTIACAFFPDNVFLWNSKYECISPIMFLILTIWNTQFVQICIINDLIHLCLHDFNFVRIIFLFFHDLFDLPWATREKFTLIPHDLFQLTWSRDLIYSARDLSNLTWSREAFVSSLRDLFELTCIRDFIFFSRDLFDLPLVRGKFIFSLRDLIRFNTIAQILPQTLFHMVYRIILPIF